MQHYQEGVTTVGKMRGGFVTLEDIDSPRSCFSKGVRLLDRNLCLFPPPDIIFISCTSAAPVNKRRKNIECHFLGVRSESRPKKKLNSLEFLFCCVETNN